MSDPKLLHRVIRRVASWAVWSFFSEIHIIGGENVPKDGPIIVTATHHNMVLDPAILSVSFPYGRIMHYWSKRTLFANPVMGYILYSSGNLPVDRKSKDKQKLFEGTFEALSKGLAVALFPEGTSYTAPRIVQVKDGAAWAALEYSKWQKAHPDKSTADVVIVPAAIVYTDKSKYRSDVIVEFGQPITMDAYKEQFHSDVEGASRAAVKRLTRAIEEKLVEATINAPDWDTLYAARMARDMIWSGGNPVNLDDFVAVSQTLVDLFSTPDATSNVASVKRSLLEYYSLLQTTNLSNSALSALPLPQTLDPNRPTPLPSRLRTLSVLVRDSAASLARLPFFLLPLLVHMPIYVMGRVGARLTEDEEEKAQNKVVTGLLVLFFIYPAAFFFLWALFWYTPTGALLAWATVWLFAVYHNMLIKDNYEHAKRFVAAWRILIGVWAPKRWDISDATLSQYTTPERPKANIWLDKPVDAQPDLQPQALLLPSQVAEPPVTTPPRRRPPTRRIIRHVLRARAEAAAALAGFLGELETGAGGAKRVRASAHLARAYGDMPDSVGSGRGSGGEESDGEGVRCGWRYAREVVEFLRERGGRIATLEKGVEGGWAALSEGDVTPAEESD